MPEAQPSALKILVLEPWFGGSHRRFLEQWQARSRHELEILGLAARHWKWRMRSACWQLARRIERGPAALPDLIFASDYLDLPSFYGMLPATWQSVPAVVYFHENQLSYPARPDSAPAQRDEHYGLTNVFTCLRANGLAFNSSFHRQEFRAAAASFLGRLPHPNPRAELEQALGRAQIIAPGIELDEIPLGPGAPADRPLRIVFNQRWEFDKRPQAMLAALWEARSRGLEFELVLLGETFEELPAGCAALLQELEREIVWRGFETSLAAYAARLGGCDLVLSTAVHEFYGVAVLEALASGCRPLVPRRLSYPEILSSEEHAPMLYADESQLIERLLLLGRDPAHLRQPGARAALRRSIAAHDAGTSAERLDRLCELSVASSCELSPNPSPGRA